MTKEDYMRLAIELARRGEGYVNPNPMVGAVIVKEGRIIGEGYHAKYGSLHAERSALSNCRESACGADVYVTLEPCCHQGRQPPCTEALIQSGVRRVYVGSRDPNPLVAGKGVLALREHGIHVVEDFLKSECDALNPVFFHYIQNHTPYVAMKYAMTMDGKIACHTGASRWITGKEARMDVQRLRHRYMGILAGIGTVLQDDPLLTCRIPGGKNPIRIVCDSRLRIPLQSQLVQTAEEIPLLIATTVREGERRRMLEDMGCQCLTVPGAEAGIDLTALMRLLGERGIDSILLEGGAALNWSALKSGIVNKVYSYIAPKMFGGEMAKSPVGGDGVADPAEAFLFRRTTLRPVGEDICIESEVVRTCSPEL